ncbi:heterokaryon incompatibility protein-domain-containing protein [Stachybotrys elegans]|uniref:Heterokaryon incompatibility protein-domain-containing protein n=1 Tax=Stachybotrys elegans TaxID=80388 RepID=A0A8K0SQA4_9HYPO|nr:heterokaryon incompatibility protein-domain-containing protein [Stachybotrys elegans]
MSAPATEPSKRPRPPCSVCNNLDIRGHHKTQGNRLNLYINPSMFKGKCEYCYLLKSMVGYFAPRTPLVIHVHIVLWQPIRVSFDTSRLDRGSPSDSSDSSDTSEFEFDPSDGDQSFAFYLQDKSPAFPGLGLRGPYLTSTELDTSTGFVKARLQKCLADHPSCSKRLDGPLPTRVLDVGPNGADVLRLVSDPNIRTRYLTLSHCWGGKQPLMTTKANLDEMLAGIEFEKLPVVFQQAVEVARKLDVQYIWIDSLCIIQDSQEDWERESPKMGDYYEQSYLTIATAASPDPTVAFLGQRDEKWRPIKFDLLSRYHGPQAVYAQRLPTTREDEGQLFSRAWAWQEAALSSRTIYFAPSDLIWECWSRITPQHYSHDLNTSGRMGFSTILSRLRQMSNDLEDDPNPRGEAQTSEAHDAAEVSESDDSSIAVVDRINYVWDDWDGLVSAYSSRLLTFAEDKLPALSGVAARVHSETKSDYVAGLWKDNLVVDLCWEVSEERGREVLAPTPTSYVAPSWSWASVTQKVETQVERTIQNLEPKVTVVEVSCEVPGLNPFGRVSKGHIALRGPLVEVELWCTDPYQAAGYSLKTAGVSRKQWFFEPDCLLTAHKMGLFRSATVRRATQGEEGSKFKVKALCLYIGVARFLDGKDKGRHFAMVLGNAGDGSGAYCRVGLANCERGDLFNGAAEKEVRIV